MKNPINNVYELNLWEKISELTADEKQRLHDDHPAWTKHHVFDWSRGIKKMPNLLMSKIKDNEGFVQHLKNNFKHKG
jgi:hypothetical protein